MKARSNFIPVRRTLCGTFQDELKVGDRRGIAVEKREDGTSEARGKEQAGSDEHAPECRRERAQGLRMLLCRDRSVLSLSLDCFLPEAQFRWDK